MFKFIGILIFSLFYICVFANNPREIFYEELKKIDFISVKSDLLALFTNSKDFWPADYGSYAPLIVRLAWHCAGSYRQSDGRGGCDGARQRFDPERSWDDNTNLDKARKLLVPIKEKYGPGLSWGDLIILAGNTAIESMNGPVFGFCAGRIDDADGTDSHLLGPTAEQEIIHPCPVNGKCKPPLGATTIGLIYVNPEGPMGKPCPYGSSHNVRDTFGRMSMNDSETVALIGGGHSFGKTHGACPSGPGKRPSEDEANPWNGTCGDGKGINSFTSGFEGSWTSNPLQFNNTYFHNLLNYDWEVQVGPGGHHQWRVSKSGEKRSPVSPNVDGRGVQDIMMLTSDISLTKDPKYLEIVKLYASNLSLFASDFSHAWYKLVTRDMGPVSRCFGDNVPPAQPFQYPLPKPSDVQPDWKLVRQSIIDLMYKESDILKPDYIENKPNHGGWFVKLAWQCASTFRQTDYLGGCNGARIRFSPQKDWAENVGMNNVLMLLETVKQSFGDNLSWADLIVLAGNIALEEASGMSYDFCSGRSDATDGSGSEFLNMNTYPNLLTELKDRKTIMGLTNREMIALLGRIRGGNSQITLGYKGTWMLNKWNNEYFKLLIEETWVKISDNEFKSYTRENIYIMASDHVLLYDAPLLAIVQEFASDNNLFMNEFRRAWTKLMNIDRFDGPVKNLCDKKEEQITFLS